MRTIHAYMTPARSRYLAGCFSDPLSGQAGKGSAGFYCRQLGWTTFIELPRLPDGRHGGFLRGADGRAAECITRAGLRELESLDGGM